MSLIHSKALTGRTPAPRRPNTAITALNVVAAAPCTPNRQSRHTSSIHTQPAGRLQSLHRCDFRCKVICQGLKAVDNFDGKFELEAASKDTLFKLLGSATFAKQVLLLLSLHFKCDLLCVVALRLEKRPRNGSCVPCLAPGNSRTTRAIYLRSCCHMPL